MTTWRYSSGDLDLEGNVPVPLSGVDVARQNLRLVLEWEAPYGAGLPGLFPAVPPSPAVFRAEVDAAIRRAVQALIRVQRSEPLAPDERIASIERVEVRPGPNPTTVLFTVTARTEATPTEVFRSGLAAILGPNSPDRVARPTDPQSNSQTGQTLFTVDLAVSIGALS